MVTPGNSSLPADAEILERTRKLLNSVSTGVRDMTPRELREQLSVDFGVDISPKKDLIKQAIAEFVKESQSPKRTKKAIVKATRSTSVSASRSSKVLHLSAELEKFCREADPSMAGVSMNMAQVRSCILKHATKEGIKEKGEIRFDEALKEIFPATSRTKKSLKIFQIYKLLKAEKQYTYWSYQ